MALSRSWRLLRSEYPDDPLFNYALEGAIAEHVGAEEKPPTIRLWQPGRCLALGRFDSRLPNFSSAVEQMRRKKILVIKRMSGGKAVWQDVGYLNFSVISPRRAALGIPEAYREYSEGLIRGFRLLGIESRFEHVEGAFCDGPYDLATTQSRKLVGTAQVQKKNFIIVHGTILVDSDVRDMVRYVSEFYELAGAPSQLRAERMTTLSEAAGRVLAIHDVIGAIQSGYASYWGHIEPEEISARELERAQALKPERVL